VAGVNREREYTPRLDAPISNLGYLAFCSRTSIGESPALIAGVYLITLLVAIPYAAMVLIPSSEDATTQETKYERVLRAIAELKLNDETSHIQKLQLCIALARGVLGLKPGGARVCFWGRVKDPVSRGFWPTRPTTSASMAGFER